MADGRDLPVWENHSDECREEKRTPFIYDNTKKPEDMHFLNRKMFELKDEVTTCLDIGCGPGFWVNLFEGCTYTGFDQSPKMLTFAKELSPDKEFVLGNARSLLGSFVERKFDLTFTSSVLQHNRHHPDKEQIVRGMHFLLRDGGYYLCTENTYRADNCPESVGNPGYTDGYSFTPEGWEFWMSQYGFKLLEYSAPSEYLYVKI